MYAIPKISVLSLFLCFQIPIFPQNNLKPIDAQIGKLNISVDPRMELLNTAQVQADYKVISKKVQDVYNKNLAYFAPYKDFDAVKTTINLSNYGFSYDAPIAFMLYLSQPFELKQQIPFSDYLIKRAGGNDKLVSYTNDLRDFALQTKFADYWNMQIPLYRAIVDETVEKLQNKPLIEQMESYYGMEQNSYNIIISPLFAGGKGARLQAQNGKYDIYASIQTTQMKDSIPYLGKNDLYYFAWHEFGHSFVNPLTQKYIDQIKKYTYLYEPISTAMANQAYSNWETCVNEHIIRAVVLRMQEIYNNIDPNFYLAAYSMEKINQFIYIDRVLEKLKEYEKLHAETKITFDQYYPEIIKAFDISKNELDSILAKLNFKGPINNGFNGKLAFIYPTAKTDTFSLEKIKNYVESIRRFLKKDSKMLPDTLALNSDLSAYNIIAYGTIKSNLWLKKHEKTFPFKISSDKVIVNKKYKGSSFKWITCLPNPQNNQKALIIYTAQQQKDIIDINNFLHGPKDYYLIDANSNKSIVEGNYLKKDGDWSFE